ncbi:MAG: 2,3-bisphosphoglycerate-independent phosphoglycerate mutase [Candidatus Eisenbacteria bacterium]|uniref:2,3-bisphosphoglycerate-independent phosphoglycerate mutase n=1 Tax=Eiseniibacteriota bacterium TaxID=2212470 RepID=A0A849SKZ1_UNCEI|nr:2,3-bisphosphoglycerate-independent phosphoglycerate mutase [Candidatus Eisenbacteria bacterium]
MLVNDLLRPLLLENSSKIVLLVLDGLGDLPHPAHGGRTPLEAARTPNLDALAPAASQGRLVPVAPGITPGSGPGHLGLFGYDPITTVVGRGVLEALGAGIALAPGDVAARANFCTVDGAGVVTDRRAGRIDTEVCARLVARLAAEVGRIEDVEILLQAGKGHRFVAVLRGPGLGGDVSDADPHKEGKPIPAARALVAGAANDKTARIVNAFAKRAAEVLRAESPANAALMRGLSARPHLEGYRERFGLRAAAIAAYPMYRGVAELAGMERFVPNGEGGAEAFALASQQWSAFDFFFIHIKGTDMAGEDGNFDAKVKVIEQTDAALPQLLALAPDVLCVTGDHSTPVPMKAHSWHPIPCLVHGGLAFADGYPRFNEKAARAGTIGTLASKDLMAVLLAHAGRLDKYGA